jgi:type I restriction enzyme R subunit
MRIHERIYTRVQSDAERDRARAEDAAAARHTAEGHALAAEQERAEWEALAASIEIDRAAIQARLDALLAAAEAAQVAAIRIDLDEAATRDLIDLQLRARGWDADSATLRFSQGTRPERGRNLAIAE